MVVVPFVVMLQQISLLEITLPLLYGCNLVFYGYLVLVSNWNCLIVQRSRWLLCQRSCRADLPLMVILWSSITKEKLSPSLW